MKTVRKKNKWKNIRIAVLVLLLCVCGLLVVRDYRTTMEAKEVVQQIRAQDAELTDEQQEVLTSYDDLIFERKTTTLFMTIFFAVVLFLVCSVGKQRREYGHISQEQARQMADAISAEYQKNGILVEENPDQVGDEAFITSLGTPKLYPLVYKEQAVQLEWDEISYADGYYIFRRTQGKKWKKIKTVEAGSTHYSDYNLASKAVYFYTLKAFRDVGDKKIISAKEPLGEQIAVEKGNIPDKPEIRVVTDENGQQRLSWSAVKNATVYRIVRKAPGEKWKKYARVSAGEELVYTDAAAQPGETYSYAVCACKKMKGHIVVGHHDKKGVSITW